MQLHQLQRVHPNKRKKRVGRGGKRGKTSGRGHKGQKARAGGTPRPVARDIIKKVPKLRGHGQNRARTVHGARLRPAVVNLAKLDKHFEDGDMVNPQVLADKKLVKKNGGRVPSVKILGQGALSKKLKFEDVTFSEAAAKKIKEVKK